MANRYKTTTTLQTNSLEELLTDFEIPLSPSLGVKINTRGAEHYKNWKDKVVFNFNNHKSTNLSWAVLFELCDEKKLKSFTETHKEMLIHVSLMDNLNINSTAYNKKLIFGRVENDVTFLAEKFFKCINPNKFLRSKIGSDAHSL